jgi:hypothetical protein
MGKLGARELNVSSDIDLIYVYEDDGQTDGIRPSAAGAGGDRARLRPRVLRLVAKRLFALIGDTTEDGFVFRVDLALRPNGNSGPPVASLGMLEEYFQVQGREWERFAWLKSRVVAPRASVTSGRALALRSLVTPFVYRRYLDYGVFEGLRQLHRKIRDEAQRRAAGRPERANDVKLSRGGIREIEFIVQLMQVVRGGQFPEIRTRSTLTALKRLAERGLMKPDTAEQLAAAYDLPAPGGAPHPVPRRPADPPAAHRRRRPGLDRGQPGPGCCRARRLRTAGPPGRGARTGGRRVRRPAGRRPAPATRGNGCRKGCGTCARSRWTARACSNSCRPELAAACEALGHAPARAGAARRKPHAAGRLVLKTGQAHARRQLCSAAAACASSTGWNRCCAARATWRCWSSGPTCSAGCCACWTWRAGPCST